MPENRGIHPNIWPPFTILKDAPAPFKVKSGKGELLFLENGKTIIDGISSWWVNLHGHAHPLIAEAIYEQAKKLEHVIFSGFSHAPAEELAETLAGMLPGSLNKVFFSDNGSTAVEVALKMAVQYWRNTGEPRNTFIAFEGAYHGDTFGAMSVAERSAFNAAFNNMLFEVDFIPFPETWLGDDSAAEREDAILESLEKMLNENPDRYAGIIIEPLVQGAGGMRMCRTEFLQKLHWVQRQYGTLLIFDEVMTGFGRTGELFACKKAQVQPDLICLSKGLTGGFLPLACTIASTQIYESFYSDNPERTLWHGHSYTANPLGCAAALASLKILKELEQFRNLENLQTHMIGMLQGHPKISKIRQCGTITAFTLKTVEKSGYFNPIAARIKEQCIEKGVLIRPLGDVVYVMPPYCIGKENLKKIYLSTLHLIDEV